MTSRRRAVAAVVAFAVLTAGLGFLAGRFVRSPAQQAADADPPAPTVLTARVERGPLARTLVVTGTVVTGDRRQVAAGDAGVVTALRRRGTTVGYGELLLAVNDRPRIALPGLVPMYRDLRTGDTGADVRRLQESLRRAGFAVVVDGTYGPSTSAAVRALYDAVGYGAPTPGPEPGASGGEGPPARAGEVAVAAELVAVPHLPATVAQVTGHRGSPAVDVTLTLTTAEPAVVAEVNPADARDLEVGSPVTVRLREGGRRFEGVVSGIGAPRTTSAGVVSTLTVRPRTRLALRDTGRPVAVTAVTGSGDVGLLVPLAAVFTRRDGTDEVRVSSAGGQRRVAVLVVGDADGRALIETAGALREGDLVVVGSR